MKALLIFDDENIINRMDICLEAMHIDTINYKWLIKALDNVEEISPHLIIISVYNYPRHWKTLISHESGIKLRGHPEIILYTPKDFSEEEEKKAKALGVLGHFSSLDEEGLRKLKSLCDEAAHKLGISEGQVEVVNTIANCAIATVDDLLDNCDFLTTVDSLFDELTEPLNKDKDIRPKDPIKDFGINAEPFTGDDMDLLTVDNLMECEEDFILYSCDDLIDNETYGQIMKDSMVFPTFGEEPIHEDTYDPNLPSAINNSYEDNPIDEETPEINTTIEAVPEPVNEEEENQKLLDKHDVFGLDEEKSLLRKIERMYEK